MGALPVRLPGLDATAVKRRRTWAGGARPRFRCEAFKRRSTEADCARPPRPGPPAQMLCLKKGVAGRDSALL